MRVAHLSDLHLVGERYGYRMECGTHGPRGNRSIRHALRKLRAIDASTPIDRVLVTGDVTDAGTRAEWVEFLDLLRCYPDIRSRVLFVPGNHDVNIVDRTNTGRFDIPWSVGHALRRLRFVVALDAVQGERVHIVDRKSGGLGPSLRDYLQEGERPARLRGLAEQGTWRGRWEIARVWDDIFPLVVPPTGAGRMRRDPPRFERPQPLLGDQRHRRRRPFAAEAAQGDPEHVSRSAPGSSCSTITSSSIPSDRSSWPTGLRCR